jgi:hypothetical protein
MEPGTREPSPLKWCGYLRLVFGGLLPPASSLPLSEWWPSQPTHPTQGKGLGEANLVNNCKRNQHRISALRSQIWTSK